MGFVIEKKLAGPLLDGLKKYNVWEPQFKNEEDKDNWREYFLGLNSFDQFFQEIDTQPWNCIFETNKDQALKLFRAYQLEAILRELRLL